MDFRVHKSLSVNVLLAPGIGLIPPFVSFLEQVESDSAQRRHPEWTRVLINFLSHYKRSQSSEPDLQ